MGLKKLLYSEYSAFWFRCTLAYVPWYGNREYVATLAHALDATLADDPCYVSSEYVSTLAHALDATLADDPCYGSREYVATLDACTCLRCYDSR